MRGDRLGFYQAELYLWAKFNLGMAHALTAGRRRCLIDIKQRALVTAHSPLNRLFLFICVPHYYNNWGFLFRLVL